MQGFSVSRGSTGARRPFRSGSSNGRCIPAHKLVKSRHAIRKEMIMMAKFIPKEKLSKKAQKELNRLRRVTWGFSPATKKVDSRKIYSRKRKARNRDDYGLGCFFAFCR